MGLPTTGMTLPLFLPQLLSTALSISLLFLPHLLSTALSISSLFLPHQLPMALSILSLTRLDPFLIGFKVPPVFLPYALSMSFSVTPVGLQQALSVLCPVTLLVLRPLDSMRCLVAPVGRRPRGSWGRSAGCPFGTVIIAFVVLDGGSAGAQLSFGRRWEQGSMRWLEAPVSFHPPGSLGHSEGCPFGGVIIIAVAFSAVPGGSAGAQFSCGTHRERVAVLVEGYLAVWIGSANTSSNSPTPPQTTHRCVEGSTAGGGGWLVLPGLPELPVWAAPFAWASPQTLWHLSRAPTPPWLSLKSRRLLNPLQILLRLLTTLHEQPPFWDDSAGGSISFIGTYSFPWCPMGPN